MICGAPRSGTTMLDLMLGNSDEAFSTGEIYAYFRPFRKHHFNPVCCCGDPDCEVWRELLHVPESRFHANILAQTRYRYVVDSSKDLRWVLDSNIWAQEQGIDCHNVVIWKDPVDLAYSYWKRGQSISWYRKVFLLYYGRFLQLQLPFVSVNYNQLTTHPSAVLEKICGCLDMPFDVRKINFWEKRHHYFFGSAGTAKQVNKSSSQIQNEREFPQEFMDEYTAEVQWSESSSHFRRILNALTKNDISKRPNDQSLDINRLIKPFWYYRHALKSIWRRRFPESGKTAVEK